jgi:hypothetical protein
MDKGKAYFGPEVMDAEVWAKLEEMEARREDLGTWEIMSLSIEDTDAMLGVLTMTAASNDGEFKWTTSSGSPCASNDNTVPKILNPKRFVDAPEALALIKTPWVVPESSTIEITTLDSPADILDASLRRGGSSFEAIRNDISVKEAVVVSYLETTGSETDSEAAGSRSDPRERTPWTPPGEGHAISHALIQRVGEQIYFVESWRLF